MQKTINLFVDMDGTIAKFYYKKNCLEKMYEKGYFANLPFYSMAMRLNDFAEKDTCVNVYILSACIDSEYCEQEKVEWLLKYMPNINPTNFIFTKVGESKVVKVSKTIPNFQKDINILLDDYTMNLNDWQQCENCIGVKFLNGMNDTTKTWQGLKIKTFGQLAKLLEQFAIYGKVE